MAIDKQKIITGAAVLIATIFGYGMALSYEAGYLAFYGIRSSFVQVTPIQLAYGVALAIFGIFAFDFLRAVFIPYKEKYDKNNPAHRAYLDYAVLVIAGLTIEIMVLAVGPNDANGNLFWLVPALFAALILATSVQPLRYYLETRSWHESFKKYYEDLDRKKNDSSSKQRTTIKLEIVGEYLPILVLVVIFLAVSYSIGLTNANYRDKDVPVIDSGGDNVQIVVRDYNGTLFLKDFNLKTRHMDGGFILRQADDINIQMRVLDCTSSFRNSDGTKTQASAICPK